MFLFTLNLAGPLYGYISQIDAASSCVIEVLICASGIFWGAFTADIAGPKFNLWYQIEVQTVPDFCVRFTVVRESFLSLWEIVV